MQSCGVLWLVCLVVGYECLQYACVNACNLRLRVPACYAHIYAPLWIKLRVSDSVANVNVFCVWCNLYRHKKSHCG